jgi:hypothetical protein
LAAKTAAQVVGVFAKTKDFLMSAMAIPLLLGGCTRDNGLPTDLTAHLGIHGIHVRSSVSQVPLSSRAGSVSFDRDPAIEARIVSEFHLKKIAPGDPRFSVYVGQIDEKPIFLYGTGGRPATLKLKDGAQLEYLYLLMTEKRCHLFAEYAYG